MVTLCVELRSHAARPKTHTVFADNRNWNRSMSRSYCECSANSLLLSWKWTVIYCHSSKENKQSLDFKCVNMNEARIQTPQLFFFFLFSQISNCGRFFLSPSRFFSFLPPMPLAEWYPPFSFPLILLALQISKKMYQTSKWMHSGHIHFRATSDLYLPTARLYSENNRKMIICSRLFRIHVNTYIYGFKFRIERHSHSLIPTFSCRGSLLYCRGRLMVL